MPIRFIDNEDELVRLFPLIVQDAKEVGIDERRIDFIKLWGTLRACMDHGAVIVADDGEVIAGIMILALMERYWCAEKVLTNLVYYVDPEHRNSTAGLGLLLAAKDYAIAADLDFDLCIESFKDLSRKDRFFRRYGFIPCGGNYKLRR